MFIPKVFHCDVLNLLSMEDMWRFRDKPVPLDFDLIQSDHFILRGQATGVVDGLSDNTSRHANGDRNVDVCPSGSTSNLNGNSTAATVNNTTVRPGHGLKDQRTLSLRENLDLFVSRLVPRISFAATMYLGYCHLQYRAPRRTSYYRQRGDHIV